MHLSRTARTESNIEGQYKQQGCLDVEMLLMIPTVPQFRLSKLIKGYIQSNSLEQVSRVDSNHSIVDLAVGVLLSLCIHYVIDHYRRQCPMQSRLRFSPIIL
jgi:hypothetical protein